jgi:threonine synthase
MKACVDELHFQPVSSYTSFPTGDPYSQEGEKTVAYEICEELGWRAPDKVLVPVGQGFALSGIWSGFVDLHELGLIDSLPAMIAVESQAGQAFATTRVGGPGASAVLPEGASVARHACSSRAAYKGLRAVEDSGGFSVVVGEKEILDHALALAQKDGVLPSTTSATTLAALRSLVDAGQIRGSEQVVCVITATGLKDVDLLQKAVRPMPGPIAPGVASLRRLAGGAGNPSFVAGRPRLRWGARPAASDRGVRTRRCVHLSSRRNGSSRSGASRFPAERSSARHRTSTASSTRRS